MCVSFLIMRWILSAEYLRREVLVDSMVTMQESEQKAPTCVWRKQTPALMDGYVFEEESFYKLWIEIILDVLLKEVIIFLKMCNIS